MKYKLTRKSNDYLAPSSIIQRALQILALENNKAMIKKFDCDVCCSEQYVPAKNYYKYGEKNGLTEPWKNYNWCNPPFDECSKWVKKAYNEQQAGRTSILLLPARVETAYWHDYILYNENVEIFWLRKGHKFIDAETKKELGVFKNPLALVLFRGITSTKNLKELFREKFLEEDKEVMLDQLIKTLTTTQLKNLVKGYSFNG